MEHKRTYIRRKKCLSEIRDRIRRTLTYISEQNNGCFSEKEIEDVAKQQSISIEAACWFPKQHITEDEYSNLLNLKAKQLCEAFVNLKLPKRGNQTEIPILSPPVSDKEDYVDNQAFINAEPMGRQEMAEFITQGAFSFSSITSNSIPPLIRRDNICPINQKLIL